MTNVPRRLWVLLLVPILLVAIGTLGYCITEREKNNYDWFDALYMTIITLSTIGYGEHNGPLTHEGRVFTIFLILGGVFSMAYSATEVIRSIVGGEVAAALGKRRMERTLAQLKDHIIVCGYGRMGRLVCREFERVGRSFVVIDSKTEELTGFQSPLGVPLQGDATSDDVLRHAGIERAHSLVAVMATDSDNLFVTMSARLLNAKLTIVARAEELQTEQKLLRAGANRVISPYEIGGHRLAHAVTKPTVVEFIELTSRTEHIELQLEESKIDAHSKLAGRTLAESRLMADHRLIIVAIKKPVGKMLFNPPAETRLEAGDILVAMGSLEHVTALSGLAGPP